MDIFGNNFSARNYNGLFQTRESDWLSIFPMIVWFQKIFIHPPQKVTGNSKGEGGLKGQNF